MIRLERFFKYALIEAIFAFSLFSAIAIIFWKHFLPIHTVQKWGMIILSSVAVMASIVFINALVLAYIDLRIEKNISERLMTLRNGNYQSEFYQTKQVTIFEMPFSVEGYSKAIDELKDKLLSLTDEVQHMSAQPQLVDGESKQDILEGERHRIARELHDSVSQQLFATMMLLATLTEGDSLDQEIVQGQLQRIEEIVNEAQIEMRALLLHLRPVKLEQQSLKDGIIGLLKELSSKVNIEISWQVEDIHLRPGNEDDLFRIVQEILSNTLRHARAKCLEVYLKDLSSQIFLRMTDNGVGFDPSHTKNKGNYGLQNVRERVEGMGGKLSIVSFKGKGTTIDIRIPKTSK